MNTNEKKTTMKDIRANKNYCKSVQLRGNAKLKDYDEVIESVTGEKNILRYRYMQFNTIALHDCPFKSKGCEDVCYATKGHHACPNVKESRQRAHDWSLRDDFVECVIYTIQNEITYSRRFKNAKVLFRIHESGDFYNLKYLRKWLKIWTAFKDNEQITFTFYTKSFLYFLQLTEEEQSLLQSLLHCGRVSINLSLDDTTSAQQLERYLQVKKIFPKANTYYCTEDIAKVNYTQKCDCANCAKCGVCNRSKGDMTAVKIHSASAEDLKKYRAKSKNA